MQTAGISAGKCTLQAFAAVTRCDGKLICTRSLSTYIEINKWSYIMKKWPVIAVFGLAASFSGTADAAVAHRQHQARSLAVPQHMACTVLGCQPIPDACYPKEEHSFGGTPTGYDTIMCPPGVWPF
jgi:hypothetical protein